MKKLLIVLTICLITSLAFAGIRMIGQGPNRVGDGGIFFSQYSGPGTQHNIVNTAAADVKNSTGGQVYAND